MAHRGWGERRIVHENQVNGTLEPVFGECGHVVGGVQPTRLAAHVGDVAHVDARRIGLAHRVCHARDQEVGDEARVERPGTDHDHVRVPDGANGGLVCRRRIRLEADVLEGVRADRERRLALVTPARAVHAVQPDVLERGRVYMPSRAEVRRRMGDRLGKRAGEVSDGSQHQVSERVADMATALGAGETVLDHAGGQPVLIGGHRHQAVPDVARRKDPELLAQLARRAAIVGHRDDGRGVEAEIEQAVDDGRQARAAADGDRTAAASNAHRASRSRPMSRWLTATR